LKGNGKIFIEKIQQTRYVRTLNRITELLLEAMLLKANFTG